MIELRFRPGSPTDADAVLAMFDEAIAWLVQRGLAGQWGELPFSTRHEPRERVRRILHDDEVRIAEHGGVPVGALAAGGAPPYAPASEVPELYVTLLLSARRLAGNGIGARLLELADALATERGAVQLRVDCWADAPALVRFYERQGFARTGRFELTGWRGQVLRKHLA
ncbi:MAG TPA: GNAT family N-acetyltransferase [Solirubrobacteraceae bacterium]|nr:GNAT family N-acetyltransferase [Solirubrobacteraceae bacterium]